MEEIRALRGIGKYRMAPGLDTFQVDPLVESLGVKNAKWSMLSHIVILCQNPMTATRSKPRQGIRVNHREKEELNNQNQNCLRNV